MPELVLSPLNWKNMTQIQLEQNSNWTPACFSHLTTSPEFKRHLKSEPFGLLSTIRNTAHKIFASPL